MEILNQLKNFGNYLAGKSPVESKSVAAQVIDPAIFGSGEGLMPKQDFWMFNLGSNGADYHFTFNGHKSAAKAFCKCAPLNAIINKKAQAYINGRNWFLNETGRSKNKVSTSEVAVNLQKLFKRPNPIQSHKEFEAQEYIHIQTFGFNVRLLIKPIGFKRNIDAYQMWNLPPCLLDIEETERIFYQLKAGDIIKKVVLTYKGFRTELNVDDLIIIKDINPSFKTLVFPESRVESHRDPINNIITAYEARRTLMKKKGALGILTNDSASPVGPMPLKPGEKDRLQEEFVNQYGIMPDQAQVIITSASLKWQSMGYPTKDLMLFEEIEDNIMRLCDGWNYPYRLLANQRTNALGGSDIKDFKALVYEDAIIPESENYTEQLTNAFGLAEFNIRIEKDYSHIPVLQKDKVQEATARKVLNESKLIEYQNGLITLDQWLESLGEDPLPDGKGKVRATDIQASNVPLAVVIGVGGVQSVIAIVTAQGMSDEAKRSTLEILFGITPENAARMAVSSAPVNPNTPSTGNTEENNNNENQSNAAA